MAEGGKNTFHHSWVEMGRGMGELNFFFAFTFSLDTLVPIYMNQLEMIFYAPLSFQWD